MINTPDSPDPSLEDMRNEEQKISTDNVELQTEELNIQKDTDCEAEEKSEIIEMTELDSVCNAATKTVTVNDPNVLVTQEPIVNAEHKVMTSQESIDDPKIIEACNIEEVTTDSEDKEAPEHIVDQLISIKTITTMFEELNRKFDTKIARDDHKNGLFDKMYAELNSYKNDIYQKLLKPFVLDTIMLIDNTNKLIRDMDKTNAEKVFNEFCAIPDDLLEILERNGIEAFNNPSDTFNPKTQTVLKIVPTDDPELNNKIESRVRQGYRWDEKIIKPEMIQCYKYLQTN